MIDIKQILLIFFLLINYSFGIAIATTYYPCAWDETEQCHDPEPPAKNALELKVSKALNAPYKMRRPDSWPVRAFYTGNDNVYEFDKQGNVLIAQAKPAKGYMVELYNEATGEAIWQGKGKVYYWYQGDTRINIDDYRYVRIILENDKACKAMLTASEYSFLLRNDKDYALYLDGDCAKSFKVKRNNKELWGYPSFKQNKEEYAYNYYWQVQYFGDPFTPIYNNWNGECLLYCDKNNTK